MRRLLTVLLSFIAFGASAQTTQLLGGPGIKVVNRGDFQADSILYLPRTLVTSRTPTQAGALRYQSSDSALYQWTGTAWRKAGGGDVDSLLYSTRAWRQKGIDSVASVRIGGSGVTGYIPKFTAARTLDSSQIFQLGGNIGFGTATPSSLYKVDVSGAIRATQANNATVQIQSTQGNAFFQLQDSSSRWQVGGSSNPPYPNGVFYVYDAKNTVNRMAIDHLGRVALGSNAPAGKLDMRQSGIVDIFMVSTTSGTQENTIQSYASNGAIWSNLDIRSNNLKLFTTTIGGTQAERMRIFENGRIGVNTTTDAGYQFDVNGTARTGTLTINTNGQSRAISTNTASGTDGFNIFIGGGGTSINGTTGNQSSANTSIGVSALGALTTGNFNTSIGYNNMILVTTGSSNTGIGNNLTVLSTGSSNTAIGQSALNNITSATQNTAVGHNALVLMTSGNDNIAMGFDAGRRINSGSSNTTSSNSIYIGKDSRASAVSNSNEIVIGGDGRGNGSNTVTIGNSSTTDNYFTGALRTSAPPGGTANAWRLGTVATVTPTSPNRTIEVSIGGTIYYIHAKTTND